jgi:hypothetical protein
LIWINTVIPARASVTLGRLSTEHRLFQRRNVVKIRTVIAAALLSTAATLAYAQAPQSQPQDHDAHHPNPAAQASPQMSAPPQAEAQTPMGQGGSMMGQGGAMSGGMMGGGNSAMNMMGNGMPMMSMMQMMGNSGSGMGGMATIDRVEGRIAFLKTEIKVTDAQNDAWNAFADVLRGNAKKLGELRASMTPQASLTDRLAWQERWLTARAENTRAIRTAYGDLAGTLTDEQKTTADQVLAPHMGMMSMMSGMSGGQMGTGQMGMGSSGQMGMGNMNSGQMPPAKMMPGNPMTTGKTAPK